MVKESLKSWNDEFKKAKQRIETKQRIIDEISSEKMLKETIDFLAKNKAHSKLNIKHDDLSSKLKGRLKFLLDDLKEYSSLVKTNNYSPDKLIKILNSISSKLDKLETSFSDHQIVTGMIDLVLNEDKNETETTVESFRRKSHKIKTVVEELSSSVNEDLIWAYRLDHIHPDKRFFFTMAHESNNRFLFLVSAHLCILAKEIGIHSKNGQANFIHKLLKPIDHEIGRYFVKIGDLDVKPNSIVELFRSKSWVCLFGK